MIVRRDGPTVRLYSRNAYDWTVRLAAIASAAERIKATPSARRASQAGRPTDRKCLRRIVGPARVLAIRSLDCGVSFLSDPQRHGIDPDRSLD
jgi:hypothetical protein